MVWVRFLGEARGSTVVLTRWIIGIDLVVSDLMVLCYKFVASALVKNTRRWRTDVLDLVIASGC